MIDIKIPYENSEKESEIKWLKNTYENCNDNLFQQYLAEVASFEKYGSTNIISYGEWLETFGIGGLTRAPV